MNAESLHKIFNNTRISSYLRNPLIKKGKSVFISKGECDYCGCENEELRNLKFKMCDECVEYYKINKEYVLNNLQIETKKDKIAERIHQSIFYSRKKIDSIQDICYPSLEGIVLIDIPTGMLGGSTFIHELGHYASLNLLYDIKPSDAHIEVYAFDNLINLINKPSYDNLWKFLTNNQGKITDFNPLGQCSYTGDLKLSNFGKLLGEEKSMGLFLAAGVAVNTLTSFGLIGLGYLLRKKKIGKPLMYAGILPAVDTAFYVFRGFFNPELETAVAPALLGLTPLTFASLIISPVPIALGLTMLKYFYDKRKSNMRKIVDNLINYDMIGKNELFTQFNTYNKNEVIDSLEEKLSKKIDWLFYSGGSEEKKVVKKIKQITKNLLEEYSGFADYLAKEFKPLVKEKKKEWKEWGRLNPLNTLIPSKMNFQI